MCIRDRCDDIMDPKVIFSPGKSVVLKDGHDVAIVACGIMVSKALRVAESLEGQGVSARVINLSSITVSYTHLISYGWRIKPIH